jgi:hypothetical protein
MIDLTKTPKSQGYVFPAEWEEHEATWLSWPHKEESWPDKLEEIYPYYCQFIKILSEDEFVRINVKDEEMRKFAMDCIMQAGANLENIEFYFHETNDAWCRDHGPAFLINKNGNEPEKVMLLKNDGGHVLMEDVLKSSQEAGKNSRRLTKISFEPIKQALKRDLLKYENIREKKRLAGIASAEIRKQNQQMSTPVESVQHTSTDSTVIVNDSVSVSDSVIVKEKKEKKRFTPPTIQEVILYFAENGYSEKSAIKSFNYYDVAEWIDSKGNKIKNWKQKMQGVWFKTENEERKDLQQQAQIDIKICDYAIPNDELFGREQEDLLQDVKKDYIKKLSHD